MEQISVASWEDFDKRLEDLRQERASSQGAESGLLFRGQENSCWSLSTTLDRKRELMPFAEYYHVISRIRPQVESLTDREWPIPEYPEVEKLSKQYELYDSLWCGRCPGYSYMAYLRHHGFPSPLLDWSRSPYVAAFFAFNKAAENSNGRVSIYVFSHVPYKLHGNAIRMVLPYGHYVKTHRRHFLQQSEYTLCVAFQSEWQFERYDTVFEEGFYQQGICQKFDIPATERRKVMSELDAYNVNALSLFGSEESMMETLATREFSLTP